MTHRIYSLSFVMACLLVTQSITSCIHQQNPELTAAKHQLAQLQEKEATLTNYDPNSYEYFVSHNEYPVTIKIYRNPALMAAADRKSRVVICLEQQRGRFYVNGQVAADWPVSTGIPGRETPKGHYKVIEKKPDHASNRYGKMYDAEGKLINGDADVFKEAVPEGGRFEGSPMPFWMRLTSDGVGMHVGKVKAGKRLSHGCIRTPREMCEPLFNAVSIGTRVSVIDALEAEFPAREALELGKTQGELERGIRRLQEKVYRLTQQELQKRKR